MKKVYCISGAFWNGKLRIRTAHIIEEINDKMFLAIVHFDECEDAICPLAKTNVYYTYKGALKAAILAQKTYKKWLKK